MYTCIYIYTYTNEYIYRIPNSNVGATKIYAPAEGPGQGGRLHCEGHCRRRGARASPPLKGPAWREAPAP